MALAATGRAANAVYTIIGDGETNEGLVWEGSMSIAKFKLDSLVAFLD